jgi:hypothetical protein
MPVIRQDFGHPCFLVIPLLGLGTNVIGRKSGHTITIPVWFVVEGEKLYNRKVA